MVMFSKVVNEYGDFDAIRKRVGLVELEAFSDRVYALMCKRFAAADYMTGVDWVMRQYLSSKKITLSALFITQASALDKLRMKNLRFYAYYYALFNGLSSNLLVHPAVALVEANSVLHSALFRDIDNYFIRFGIYNGDLLKLLSDVRFTRELYSYHLPLSGSGVSGSSLLNEDAISVRLGDCLTQILQVSNLLSFLAYYAWDKKVGRVIDEYDKNQENVDALFFSILTKSDHLEIHTLIDDADYQRMGYALNKIGSPMPISWFMEDKLLDDLESNWGCDEEVVVPCSYDIEEVSRYLADAIGS